MKRFLAFYGQAYYPSSGMGDFLNDFDTIEEGKAAIASAKMIDRPDDTTWDFCWGQIYDIEKREVVYDV